MKNLRPFLIFSLLLFSLCSCSVSASSPQAAEIRKPTCQSKDSSLLSPETEQSLDIYPLRKGSTWIYDYLGYDRNMEVVWKVYEEVVDTRIWQGYYLAELERSIVLIDGHPGGNFMIKPEPGRFWYVVDGQNLYRFNEALSSNLSNAWLDLVLPFLQDGQGWYPYPDQRALSQAAATGFRYASAPFERVLPQGGTYTCYNVTTRYPEGIAEGTFCEKAGFVFHEFNSYNWSYGYRIELEAFSLK